MVARKILSRGEARRLHEPHTFVRELKENEGISIPAASTIELVSTGYGKAKLRITSSRGIEAVALEFPCQEADTIPPLRIAG